ncbi:Uncharacterised protein [uncultured archaeon]|nr:Uncharacterised protein [uncultured archaeon]
MKAILFFIVLMNIIAVASASEWEEHTATVYWGKSVDISGYNITAADFRPGTVEEPTNKTKCDVESDAFKRKAWGCDDYVFLKISKNSDPLFLDALTQKNNTFIDGSEFYNETVYEDAQGSLKIIALDVVTGKYIPSPYAELKILVKSNEFEFDIANNFTIVKTVPPEAHVNPSYPFIPVLISVKNIGTYDFSYIWVNDSISEGIISKPQELGWGKSLKKGEIWQEEYFIKPLKPVAGKEYTLPPATLYVVFNNITYNLSTGTYPFILRSSDIIVTKTADKAEIGEPGNVTVNIKMKNNGSRAALIKVRDSILPDMEIMGGELNFSIVLQPDESYNNSYILKLNNISDNVTLPYARFDFKEYWSDYNPETKTQNNTGSGISNQIEIKSVSASKQDNTASPESAPDEKTPVNASSAKASSSPTKELSSADTSWDILNIIRSLLSPQQLPYVVLVLLAGGGLAVFINRTISPKKDKQKDKSKL